eukprot:3996184-Prymnesium_polylepis.1
MSSTLPTLSASTGAQPSSSSSRSPSGPVGTHTVNAHADGDDDLVAELQCTGVHYPTPAWPRRDAVARWRVEIINSILSQHTHRPPRTIRRDEDAGLIRQIFDEFRLRAILGAARPHQDQGPHSWAHLPPATHTRLTCDVGTPRSVNKLIRQTVVLCADPAQETRVAACVCSVACAIRDQKHLLQDVTKAQSRTIARCGCVRWSWLSLLSLKPT